MPNPKKLGKMATVIIASVAVMALLRLVFPALDYFPPERLVRDLERSWFVDAGLRTPAMVVYGTVALTLMTVFFLAVQGRWAVPRPLKGLIFGCFLGVVWALGFLTGWGFLGTTLRAELLNGAIDLAGLAIAGWLIGLATAENTRAQATAIWKPWLAVALVASGFLAVHTPGGLFLATWFGRTADLFLRPSSPPQTGLLLAVGAWAGVMFVALRHALPVRNVLGRSAVFAFGIFGHSWTLFHLFFVIEFKGVLATVLLVGLTGAAGVFVGILAYESVAGSKMSRNGSVRPRPEASAGGAG
jgi:hypothetical protein